MDLGSLRTREMARAADIRGVPATVTAPLKSPVTTRVIWLTPIMLDVPGRADFQRREPVLAMALKRADVPEAPRGTKIVAPEKEGEANKNWLVDALERQEKEHHRVVVIEVEVFP